MSNATFNGNIIGGGGGNGFGTVDYEAMGTGDALTVSGSRFISDTDGASAAAEAFGGGFGGGLDVSAATAGTVAITGSTFASNSAGGAGGADAISGNGFGGGVARCSVQE